MDVFYSQSNYSSVFLSLVSQLISAPAWSHTPLELNMELGSYKHAVLRIIAKKSMKYYKFTASRLAGVQTPVVNPGFCSPRLNPLGVCWEVTLANGGF